MVQRGQKASSRGASSKGRGSPTARTVRVNRAPVLTLWGAVVAERLGYDRATALTLGKAIAGLNALAKGRRLGLYHETPEDDRKRRARARAKAGVTWVELMGRRLPVAQTGKGLRAVRDRTPQDPAAVERYLEGKLGDSLAAARASMTALARSIPRRELSERAFALYEKFRPSIPSGERGWGAKGELDIARVRALARKRSPSRPRSKKPTR
jgi:hypothetical protein